MREEGQDLHGLTRWKMKKSRDRSNVHYIKRPERPKRLVSRTRSDGLAIDCRYSDLHWARQ